MSKVQTFKMDRERSDLIHKIIGVAFIILAIILLLPYFIHFIKIMLSIALISLGVYFLTKETRFRWFRIRRF